jgi:hypothetical protein
MIPSRVWQDSTQSSAWLASCAALARVGAGVAVEAADHAVEGAQRGLGGQPDPEHRDPFVSGVGDRPVPAYLAAVEPAGEDVGDRGLAQPGQRVDDRGAAQPVGVLAVGRHDQLQLLQDGGKLRGAQGAEVGVPVVPGLVVVGTRILPERGQPGRGQPLRLLPGGGVHVASPAFLAGQAVEGSGHSMTAKASA